MNFDLSETGQKTLRSYMMLWGKGHILRKWSLFKPWAVTQVSRLNVWEIIFLLNDILYFEMKT